MRLTEQQIQSIIKGLESFIQAQAELRLYGSRVNDQLKGGDIDLLIMTEKTALAENLVQMKHVLLASIKKFLGDQKIDLTIAAKQDLDQDVFLKMIYPKSVLLMKW